MGPLLFYCPFLGGLRPSQYSNIPSIPFPRLFPLTTIAYCQSSAVTTIAYYQSLLSDPIWWEWSDFGFYCSEELVERGRFSKTS